MHQALALEKVEEFFEALRELDSTLEAFLVGYTRHQMVIDDASTMNPRNKINPHDVAFHWLGFVLPGVPPYGSGIINLDYYASPDGLLLSVTPVNTASLTQALTEYLAGSFSFSRGQFTGNGARHYFELDDGDLVPNRAGCSFLTAS